MNNKALNYYASTILELFELIGLLLTIGIKKIRKFIIRNFRNRRNRLHKLILIGLCLLISVFIVLIALSNDVSANEGNNKTEYKYFTQITVNEGDTLWGIANRYKGDHTSINDELEEIKHINNLRSNNIIEGQSLVIPYYSYEYK